MTIREKMARAVEAADNATDDWLDYDEIADAALSVLTNPDDETMERLAKVLCRSTCSAHMTADEVQCQVDNGWDLWTNDIRAILAALKEEV